MAAIGATRAEVAPTIDPSSARHDPATADGSGFHRLWERSSGLDHLLADAGPLGKFLTDAPDRMPSGTSALTLKIGDALNRLAARLGLPSERILSGPVADPRHVEPLPPADLPPGDPAHRAHGITPDAAKPASETSTHVHITPHDRGEPGA